MKYKTIKAAREDGFQPIKPQYYGGELIHIKGHTLVRNPNEARSKTAWKAHRCVVLEGEQPHAVLSHRVGSGWGGGKMVTYEVWRYDQVEDLA